MGLFALEKSEEIEDLLTAAIANINLYLEHEGCTYLLEDFALNQLKTALEKERRRGSTIGSATDL